MRDVADHPAACWLQPAASADACAPSLALCPACGEPMGCNGRYPRGYCQNDGDVLARSRAAQETP